MNYEFDGPIGGDLTDRPAPSRLIVTANEELLKLDRFHRLDVDIPGGVPLLSSYVEAPDSPEGYALAIDTPDSTDGHINSVFYVVDRTSKQVEECIDVPMLLPSSTKSESRAFILDHLENLDEKKTAIIHAMGRKLVNETVAIVDEEESMSGTSIEPAVLYALAEHNLTALAEQQPSSLSREEQYQQSLKQINQILDDYTVDTENHPIIISAGEDVSGLSYTDPGGAKYRCLFYLNQIHGVGVARFYSKDRPSDDWQHAGISYWNGVLEDIDASYQTVENILSLLTIGSSLTPGELRERMEPDPGEFGDSWED